MRTLRRFILDEQGLETVEYALIMGLVSVGSIAIIAAIGVWVTGSFESIGADLETE